MKALPLKIILKLLSMVLLANLSYGQRKSSTTVLETDSKFVYGIAFNAEGELLAVGDNNVIKIFSFHDRELVAELTGGHTGEVMTVAFSNNNKLLVSGGKDGKVILWDLSENIVKNTFMFPESLILTVDISEDNRFLAAGGTSNKVYVIDIDKQEVIKEFTVHEDDVLKVKFNPMINNMLVSAGADHKIIFYDTDVMDVVDIKTQHTGWVRGVDFNNEGNRMISGDDKGYILTWNVARLGEVRQISSSKFSQSWITGVSFHDDNTSYALSNISGRVLIRTPFSRLSSKNRFPVHQVLMKPGEPARMSNDDDITTRSRIKCCSFI